MRAKLTILQVVALVAAATVGCATHVWVDRAPSPVDRFFLVPDEDGPIYVDDASMVVPGVLWLQEAKTRFEDPVLVIVHGANENDGDRWTAVHTDDLDGDGSRAASYVDDLADAFRRMYPHSTIVFVVCNPHGVTLDKPNTAYARDDVWMRPDGEEDLIGKFRDIAQPNVVGSIAEFIHNP